MLKQIETINRFLASIEALQVDTWANGQDVGDYYKTQYIYPVRDAFKAAREFGIMSSFIEARKNKLRLAKLGQEYFRLGPNKKQKFPLEPNSKQKLFLNKNVFLEGALSNYTRDLLSDFQKDRSGNLFILKKNKTNIRDQDLMNLLLQSGLLVENKQKIMVSQEYAENLKEILPEISPRIVTPETFKIRQKERERLAQIAEKYVLDYERTRLRKLGAQRQSKDIDYTAEKNVAAGYDITSFNNRDSKRPDRFIEVKAGGLKKIRFFLSRREFETAQKLKSSYWIYYVATEDFKPHDVKLFKNPIKSVLNNPKFDKRVDTYEVFEV